jgi:small nuclear ribonucleoprotein
VTPRGAIMPIRPLNLLKESLSNRVIVELKGGREFRGTLDGYDIHMNLVLMEAEEIMEGEVVKKSSTTIVRGDNVIYISP